MAAALLRRRPSILLVATLLAGPAAAQFDQFTWTFSTDTTGSGTLTPDTMTINGPDGFDICGGGSTAAFTTTAPYDLVVVVRADVDNQDKFPGTDYMVTMLDGEWSYVALFAQDLQVVLQVPAGASFGFGVHSDDCTFGKAVATLTEMKVVPAPQALMASGTGTGQQFGAALASLQDSTGDGVPEIAVGAPFAGSETGRVTLHSGADLTVVGVLNGVAPGDRFGTALAAVGDQNGDGLADLLVGAPRMDVGVPNNGAARLYSGATFALLTTLPGTASGDEFGRALTDAGDLDGDGQQDLLIGAPRQDGVGLESGQVVALAGGGFAVLHSWTGAAAGDQLGSAVAGIGDVDGDGTPDVAIGSPLADVLAKDSGRAQVFSGATGALVLELAPLACNGDAGDGFGSSLAGVGDVNGDGTPDVAVGVPGESCNGWLTSGDVRVYSGADAHLIFHVFGSAAFEHLSAGLAGPGDVDGEGTPDVAVGSPRQFTEGGAKGQVQILAGDDGALVAAFPGTQELDAFGQAVAAAGDTDGDGFADLLVGSPAPQTQQAGAAFVKRPTVLWTDLGQGLAGGAGTPALEGQGLLVAGTPLKLTLKQAPPHLSATLIVGAHPVALPFKGGVLVPAPDLLLSGLTTPVTLGQVLPPGFPADVNLWFQMWLADPAGPKGLSASNALRADFP
jgi:hypothetical protein